MSARLPVVSLDYAVPAETAPEVPLRALDTVWLQLTGTLCNIACRHCFITCGPKETRVATMSAAAVATALDDAERLGVREIYFTGGEPMLHPEFFALAARTLERFPLTVLTNGMLFGPDEAARARRLFDESRWSFDLRVSLDGMTAAENDPVRGGGTFDATVAGLRALAAAGVSPTITVVEHTANMAAADARARFLAFTRDELGLRQPRVKFLPLLRIGREERRTHGYADGDLDCLRGPLLDGIEDALVCATSRLVTADGVMTCPILLDAPGARLGATLSEARRSIRLRWSACRTCVAEGLSCNT